MLYWLVGDRELPQVAPDHLTLCVEAQHYSNIPSYQIMQHLDFHLVEGLPLVDAHNTPNHLRYYDHITQMSLHTRRLLHGRSLLLCFAQSLDQCQRFPLQTYSVM